MKPGDARSSIRICLERRRKRRPAEGRLRRRACEAHTVVKRRFLYDRGVAAAIREPRRRIDWNPRTEEMTIWDTTQAPIPNRNGLAAMLGLLESQVRVIAPFSAAASVEVMMFYRRADAPVAAMRLGRPLKWTEDRQENFFATTQERDKVQ